MYTVNINQQSQTNNK